MSNSNRHYYKCCCEDANHLDVCDNARGKDSGYAVKMAARIRAAIRRERIEYVLKYPWGYVKLMQWFIGRVLSYADIHGVCTVVTHEAITERKFVEDGL